MNHCCDPLVNAAPLATFASSYAICKLLVLCRSLAPELFLSVFRSSHSSPGPVRTAGATQKIPSERICR